MQNWSQKTKQRVAVFFAGVLSFFIFGAWLFYRIGLINSVVEESKQKGFALFTILDNNVGEVYQAFSSVYDQVKLATSTVDTEVVSSTTEADASTTSDEIINQ